MKRLRDGLIFVSLCIFSEREMYQNRYCRKHGETRFVYESSRSYYRCMKCRQDNVANQRRKQKRKLVEIFGGKCEICGYDKCIRNLHFHHIDKSTKSFGIAQQGISRSFKTLLNEVSKCILVCSNCHGELEDGVLGIPNDLMNTFLCRSMVG